MCHSMIIGLKPLLSICVFMIGWFILATTAKSFRFGRYEYFIEAKVTNYSQAEDQCESKKATLAILNSKEIRDFLVTKLGTDVVYPYSFYIGLKRINKHNDDNTFEWIDGTSISAGYQNWRAGNPSDVDGNERCVVMGWIYELDADYKWTDIPCNKISRYICQRPLRDKRAAAAEVRNNIDSAASGEGPIDSTTEVSDTTEILVSNPTNEPSSLSVGDVFSIVLGIIIVACIGLIVTLIKRIRDLRNTISVFNSMRASHLSDVVLTSHTPSSSQAVSMKEIHGSTESQSNYVNC